MPPVPFLSTCTKRSSLRTLLAGLTAPLLQACSPLGLINALTPSHTHRVQKDLAYGPEPRHALDLYLPTQPDPRAPLVVFFYGGSWSSGRRADYTFVGEALASRGIGVAVADYGLSPQVRYPEFLEDCALAVDWALVHAAEFGGQSVHVMGHSAGAYNAAMLALDPRWLGRHGRSPQALGSWIGLAGPYDFLPIGIPEVQLAFHWPDTPEDSQPLFHVPQKVSPKALLLAARNDNLVDPQRNTVALGRSLAAQGVAVQVELLDGLGHASLIGALARPLRGLGPVLDRVAGFLLPPASAEASPSPRG
ncbi:MAG: alpha/beta hydrolase [Burkholderiaceae bacterium]|nr:alpha/beta hydrolase [Burkholderiaceae bacterium]